MVPMLKNVTVQKMELVPVVQDVLAPWKTVTVQKMELVPVVQDVIVLDLVTALMVTACVHLAVNPDMILM